MKTVRILLLKYIIFLFILQKTPAVLARALPAGLTNEEVPSSLNYGSLKLRSGRLSLLQSGCPDPGIPINGHRILLVKLQPEKVLGEEYFPIGAKLRFGCEADYLLRGSAWLVCERVKGKRAHWDFSTPQCVAPAVVRRDAPDPCGPPPTPSSFAVTSSYVPGTSVVYSCLQHHIASSGDSQLSCENGTWVGQPLHCRPLAMCEDNVAVTNGQRFLTGTREGDVVAFQCSDGYSLLGARQLRCNRDGNWDLPWPLCLRDYAQCGDPGLAADTHRIVHGTREGGVVEYSCKFGYRLVGAPNRTCLSSGRWSGSLPACEVIDCGLPGAIARGNVEFSSTTFGSEATYGCESGLFLSGQSTTSCGGSGYWISPPPTCKAVSCPRLAPPMYGNVNFSLAPNMFGSDAIFSCHPGFGMMGEPSRSCQADGSWSGRTPSCIMGSCGSLSSPANGQVKVTHTRYGGYAFYSCNEGHIMDGTSARVCQVFGKWSLTPPTCMPVTCPVLTPPTDGSVWPSNSNVFESEAVYSCDTGFVMFGGSYMRKCQANGRWTGSMPFCFGMRCPRLTPPHQGAITYTNRVVGNEAVYSCNPGFEFTFGDKIRTCLSDRKWSGMAPCCIQKDILCPNLTNPTNGVVKYSNQLGEEASYKCSNASQLLGDPTRTCQADGTWSGDEPSCALPCPILSAPAGGNVSQNGTVPGSVACYSCEAGLTLIGCGSATTDCVLCRTCDSSGVWDGPEPICSDVSAVGDCGSLPSPVNGSVDLSEGTIVNARAKYSCDAGFQLVGLPTRTCLGDENWSGSAPTCAVIECDSLLPPNNGVVELGDGRKLGAIAKYSCIVGHIISGNVTRECLVSGVWSGMEPTCVVRDCGVLVDPSNGVVDLSNGTIFTSVAIYSCFPGFLLNGTTSRLCRSDGSWSELPPTCEVLRCEMLTPPLNGLITLSDSNVANSTATYSCVNTSFVLEGNSTRRCTSEGWTGTPPNCTEVLCPELATPDGGLVALTTRSVGSLAEYSCEEGSRIVGPGQRTCLQNGTWSDFDPVCEEIFCPVLTSPSNGQVTVANRSVGSVAEYSCSDDFRIVGPEQRTCLQNGTWTDTEPACIEILCPVLLSPLNGAVVVRGNRSVGSVAEYDCGLGFSILGPNNRTCLQNGMWTGADPTCELISCPELVAPGNGSVNVTGRVVASTASYSCMDGFFLEGQQQRICLLTGNWSGTDPSCSELFCPELLSPSNGQVAVTNRSLGSVAEYSCGSGFTIVGPEQRTCLRNGTWSNIEPACTETLCPVLQSPPDGAVVVRGNRSIGSVAEYDCRRGFLILGPINRTCLQNGTWTGTDPICEIISCPELVAPGNGSVNATGRVVNSTASYSCMDGFFLEGQQQRTCLLTGNWSGTDPSCTAIMCPTLSDPVNGAVDTPDRRPGGVASYSCDSMLTLVGNETRICGMNGEWDGVAPECRDLNCPDLPNPLNGMVDIRRLPLPSRAIYRCSSGFGRNGSQILTCGPNGEWIPDPPTCISVTTVTCPALTNPIDGSILLTSRNLDGVAAYQCNPGFTPVGTTLLLCLVSGTWSATPPTCQAVAGTVSCPILEAPSDGEVTITTTTVGSTATFVCTTTGFVLVGLPERECLDNGTWSGAQPTCEPVDCGELQDPVNGQVILPQPTTILDDLAIYTCNDGYFLEGVPTRVCLSDGMWSGRPPTCTLITCPVLQNPAFGTVDTSLGNLVNSIATYQCDFRSDGPLLPRVCQANGVWTGSEPTCLTPVAMSLSFAPIAPTLECPIPLPPPNGTVAVSVDGFISTAIFGCHRGFVIEGDSVQTCEAGQQWSGAPPTCKKITCGNPGQPVNGRLLAPVGFEIDSRAYFIPRDGYDNSDASSTAQCGEDGQWNNPAPSFSAATDTRAVCSEGLLDEFGRQCECTGDKEPVNCCRYRREWSQLSDKEKHRYISTVLLVSSNSTYLPLYRALVQKYHTSFTTLAQSSDSSVSHFLLWHRYFLLEYEDLLRMVHRDITIPYWDWARAGHSPYSTPLFDSETGFGNSSDPTTNCVTSGPFQEAHFKVERPNAISPTCLTRKYEDFTFPEALIDTLASANLSDYASFHEFVQIFLGLNIRCLVGGDMCSTRAATDPLFVLHLTGMDRFVQLWQDRNPDHFHFLLPSAGKNEDLLANTFDNTLRLKDFSRNRELAFGTCVKYYQDVRKTQPDSSNSSQDDGADDLRKSLSSLCLESESAISESGVELSDKNKAFISSICNVT